MFVSSRLFGSLLRRAPKPLSRLAPKIALKLLAPCRHRGLFAQTLAVTLGVSLVPSGGLLIANHRAGQLQTAALEAAFAETAAATRLQVDQWIETNLRALQQNAALADVASMDTARQNPVMETLAATYDWTYIAFVVGPHGYQTARNDAAAKPVRKWNGELAHFRGDRQYFQQVMAGAEAGSELLISRTTSRPALCLSVPVERQRQRVGVLASCSHLDAIAAAVVNTRMGETGFAILVDGENRVVAHGQSLRAAEDLEDFSRYPALQTGQSDKPQRFRWRGRRVTAYVQPLIPHSPPDRNAQPQLAQPQLAGLDNWRLIIQQDTAEADRPLNQSRWMTVSLLGTTGLLTLTLASVFSLRLVRPLESLTAIADEVSRGQLKREITEGDRPDEIGALARSIKRLAASVAIAFEELERRSARSPAGPSADLSAHSSPHQSTNQPTTNPSTTQRL